MKRSVLMLVLLCATRTALGVTCDGFSIVPADHVIVKYSAALPKGATVSPPIASFSGTNVAVSRNISGASATDVACVDDRVDLGILGAGRFNLTWSDNAGFTSVRRSPSLSARRRPEQATRRPPFFPCSPISRCAWK